MDNAQKIWARLISAGLTPAGAAGLMGSLYPESGLRPDNLQNSCEDKLGYTDATYTAAVDSGAYDGFVTDGAGYGLAQWTYPSRKAGLLACARAQGHSIGDLDILSYNDDAFIRQLYAWCSVDTIIRNNTLAGNSDNRVPFAELIIKNL